MAVVALAAAMALIAFAVQMQSANAAVSGGYTHVHEFVSASYGGGSPLWWLWRFARPWGY
jgi:hypothetical protein